MDFNEKKLALFDAHLSHKGLQHIVDMAANLFGNPLFMGDMSLGLVFKSSNLSELGVDYSGDGDVKLQVAQMRKAVDAGYMDWIYKHDASIIGEIESQRYLSARVRDGKLVIGHIVVVERDRPFERDDELLLPIVCQTVAYELRSAVGATAGNRAYAQLLRHLLEGVDVDDAAAGTRLAALGYRAPSQFRVLVFGAVADARVASLTFLQAQLDQAFVGSMGIIKDEMYIHLVDGALSMADTLARVKSSAYLGGLRAGVGWPVESLGDLHISYLQAQAAFRLSPNREAGTVTPYDDVFARHVMELALEQSTLPEGAFVPLWLQQLEHIDEQGGADFLPSLRAFLNSGGNIAKAAQSLGLHKNSMYYRIERIEQLTGVDLSSERERLIAQLAIAARQLQEQ